MSRKPRDWNHSWHNWGDFHGNFIKDACGVASPHSQTTPKQSAGILWAPSLSQGSAGRFQGENNCNDFHREPYLLHRSKTFAATNAEVHGKKHESVFFFAISYWFWGSGASRRQLRREQKNAQEIFLSPSREGSKIYYFGNHQNEKTCARKCLRSVCDFFSFRKRSISYRKVHMKYK